MFMTVIASFAIVAIARCIGSTSTPSAYMHQLARLAHVAAA
jgi:hypothetical protein